jgi:HD-GYP domain-containing protein (c-di-GMP phosphodiesterase class II)
MGRLPDTMGCPSAGFRMVANLVGCTALATDAEISGAIARFVAILEARRLELPASFDSGLKHSADDPRPIGANIRRRALDDPLRPCGNPAFLPCARWRTDAAAASRQAMTGGHQLEEHGITIARLAGLTAERLLLPDAEVDRIRLAALLHDVGKTAIPDALLCNPGKLDALQWQLIRTHPLIGERIVRGAASLAHTAHLVRSSHERFDGEGYPDGLAGEEIPEGSRVIAVCDAFDAMITDRPYRRASPVAKALLELRREAGTQFDLRVVNAFCEIAAHALIPARALAASA